MAIKGKTVPSDAFLFTKRERPDFHSKYRKGTFEVDVPEKCFYYTKAVKRRIVKLRAKGLTWKELEEATGVSTSTCRKWVTDYCEKRGTKPQLLVPVNSSLSRL